MIPREIHFVFGMKRNFGGRPFCLVHYLAVKSALEVHKPDKIRLYFAYEPGGRWWEAAKKLVEPVRVKAPRTIYEKRLRVYAHRADVLRLQILQERGGIYLDLDTISVRPLDDLMDNETVLGLQGKPPLEEGLCNAVILSRSRSEFLAIWLEAFRSMKSRGHDRFWDEMAVKTPYRLWREHPERLTVVDHDLFFHPLYDQDGLSDLFRRCLRFPRARIHHLWELMSWRILKRLSVEEIKTVDTTYNILAREFL